VEYSIFLVSESALPGLLSFELARAVDLDIRSAGCLGPARDLVGKAVCLQTCRCRASGAARVGLPGRSRWLTPGSLIQVRAHPAFLGRPSFDIFVVSCLGTRI
jgi:hypothetical protein